MDGELLCRTDLIASNALAVDMPAYTNGALGCALSHLVQWDLAAKGISPITVAEDDAIFHLQFEVLADKVSSSLPADWDLILWGWNFDSILAFDMLPGVSSCVGIFNQEDLRANTDRYQNMHLTPVAYRLQRAFGTVCLTVSPAGADKLLRHCLPIRRMETFYPILNRSLPNMGIDNMLNELYPRINAYVSVPPLVITKNEPARSTVQTE